VEGEGEEATYEEAWYLAGAVVGLQALSTLCFNHNMYLAIHIGMKMKASTCSLIFRKVVELILLKNIHPNFKYCVLNRL
jgi:hypothetical protein